MNKLYENDSYMKECESVVTDCIERDGKYFISLSDSIFFPEEGGQYADTGFLSFAEKKIILMDGQIRKGIVSYQVSEPIEAGARVICHLDWDKRFSRMQQHSCEHIISGLIHKRYGFNNVGFHLSDDGPVTLDTSGPLTADQVYQLEEEVNEIITQNLKIYALYPDKEELADYEYRSKIEIEGQVRLICIGEGESQVDVCACCAPHVGLTGEIGQLVITNVQNYKGGSRISMLAGSRAAEYVRERLMLLDQVAGMLTTAASEIPGVVKKQKEEIYKLKTDISALLEEKLISAIKEAEGDDKCIFMSGDINNGAIKRAMEEGLKLTEGYLIILIGDDEKGYSYQLSSRNKAVLPLQKELAQKLSAKGGGKEPLVAGRLMATEIEIRDFFARL